MSIKSWSELPVGKLEEIRAVNKAIDDEDTKILTIAGILADKTYNEMLYLPLSETQSLIANTAFLYEEPKPKKISSVYSLNGTEYKIMKKINDITTAQFIDYQSIATESSDRISEFLSIFFIPIGCKYNDGNYDREKVVDDISSYLSAEEALGIANFFIKRFVRSTKRTLLLLESQMILMQIGPKEQRKMAKEAAKAIRQIRYTYGLVW
jgi:hypothetical protein